MMLGDFADLSLGRKIVIALLGLIIVAGPFILLFLHFGFKD